MTSVLSLKKGDKCLLKDLAHRGSMNGELCKIIGAYRLDEDRYPVFVYKTKERALIKSENLKKVKVKSSKSRSIVSTSSNEKYTFQMTQRIGNNQQNILKTILSHTLQRRKHNQAKLFADNIMKSHPERQFDARLANDLRYMLHGNCIYIPSFFNQYNNNKKDMTLFNYLMQDLEKTDCNHWMERFKRLIVGFKEDAEDDENDHYVTFRMIAQCIADYFDVEMNHCILNLYRNGIDHASYHTDTYDRDKTDITIGASFGNSRDLSWLHKKTKLNVNIQQNNCDIFAFTSKINSTFRHGILKTTKKVGPRFSIIVWGKRRTLNARNSSLCERLEKGKNSTW